MGCQPGHRTLSAMTIVNRPLQCTRGSHKLLVATVTSHAIDTGVIEHEVTQVHFGQQLTHGLPNELQCNSAALLHAPQPHTAGVSIQPMHNLIRQAHLFLRERAVIADNPVPRCKHVGEGRGGAQQGGVASRRKVSHCARTPDHDRVYRSGSCHGWHTSSNIPQHLSRDTKPSQAWRADQSMAAQSALVPFALVLGLACHMTCRLVNRRLQATITISPCACLGRWHAWWNVMQVGQVWAPC